MMDSPIDPEVLMANSSIKDLKLQATTVVLINGPVLDSAWTPKFDMKHLKKAEGHIGWNVVSITIKMRSIVWIF